jgi:hypothetical protein
MVDPYYAGSYSLLGLGSAPGIPGPYGGLAFNSSDPNMLLLGGAANGGAGVIDAIAVTRDGSGHVTGFSGSALLFSTAANIDGGLQFGPGGVLFYTGYPSNLIGQIKPGSTSPDRTDPAPIGSSVGSLAFTPAGFPNAGGLALASYNAGTFCQATVTPDGSGTYNIGACGPTTFIGGGPEGILYVPIGSALFPVPSILVSEYSTNSVASYELDINGNPIVATRRLFITGLSGAEGAALDPLTNDFLFSTFNGGNQVLRVSGFAAPPTETPEPTSFALFGFGLCSVALFIRKRRA